MLTGDFVTEEAGCGVVHCAPAFGEEDYKVRVWRGLGLGIGCQGVRAARGVSMCITYPYPYPYP